jgi:predicted DNA-binding protein
MKRTNRNLSQKITIQITRPMLADLQNLATKSGEPIAEIVRQAIRNALDETDLTLGTRRAFDRRFQKRMEEMEQNLLTLINKKLEPVEQNLRQSLSQSIARLPVLVGREVDEALGRFYSKIMGVLTSSEEQRKKRRW